jgi:hypothetical protein
MANSPALAVQTPLNLVMPIKEGEKDRLVQLLAAIERSPGNPLHAALNALGNVHFAQFVFLERGTRLGVFTIYDGDFDDYILSFVEHIGDIFNKILQHIGDGGSDLIPVQDHREKFLEFIQAHDFAGLGQFSAYPARRAFDIQDALKEATC